MTNGAALTAEGIDTDGLLGIISVVVRPRRIPEAGGGACGSVGPCTLRFKDVVFVVSDERLKWQR